MTYSFRNFYHFRLRILGAVHNVKINMHPNFGQNKSRIEMSPKLLVSVDTK